LALSGSLPAGGHLSLSETPSVPWRFHVKMSDGVTTLAVPVLPGAHKLRFGVPGLADVDVTIKAGAILDVDATPKDIRSAVRFHADDPEPFPQAALQIMNIEHVGVEGTGHLRMAAEGFEAKFFPAGGAATDDVAFTLEWSGERNETVTVPASGALDVELGRVDVDDVAVSAVGAATKVRGNWTLERRNADGTYQSVSTCAQANAQNRCTGGAWASNLPTTRGLFAPAGDYRVLVTFQTEADTRPQTKQYDISLP
jgi:hypothetical protein